MNSAPDDPAGYFVGPPTTPAVSFKVDQTRSTAPLGAHKEVHE